MPATSGGMDSVSGKIPDGWMYNVWGLDAIDVVDETGKVFRIGTDDPENLLAVLSLLTTK